MAGIIRVIPENFKTECKLVSQDDKLCHYKDKEGKEFELENEIADLIADSDNSLNIGKLNPGAAVARIFKDNPKWKEVNDFLISVGGEASSAELAAGVNCPPSNIRRKYDLNGMEDKGLLVGEQVGKEKRYSLPS